MEIDKSELIERLNSKNWVGILQLDSKNKYPSTKKGVPQYLWHPLHHKICPEFLVSSNLKTGIPTYALITYKEWSGIRPTGIIYQYLGQVGDPTAEILARLHYHQLALSNWKKINLSGVEGRVGTGTVPTWKYSITDEKISMNEHIDMTHLEVVYSIDPEGCRDIDDAFSYQSDERILGIHIADVGYILRKTGLLNTLFESNERYSSVYLPNRVLHMLPEAISTDIASLLPNQPKLVWTLWIQLDSNNRIKEYRWERNIIKSRKAWSYEEAELSGEIQDIAKIVREMGERELGMYKEEWTTHEMVEVLMVLMNHYLGKDLAGFKYGIYRVHNKTNKIVCEEYDKELNKILELLEMDSAEYVYNNGEYYHGGLGLDKYTHGTSPIRRVVDIYNHLMLEELIYGDKRSEYQPWKLDLEGVNDFQKRTKRLKRDLDRIELMDCESKEYEGYLIGNEGKYQLYLVEKRLLINVRLWSEKIAHLIVVEESEKEMVLNGVFSISKYQRGKYRIYSQQNSQSFNDKIKVEIAGLSEFLNSL